MLEDRGNANHPSPSRAQLDREHDAAQRQADQQRYLAKFKPIFEDIARSIAALEVLAEYDSAARDAANGLKDALHDARWTVESNA